MEASRSAAERLAFLCMWQLQKKTEGGGGHSAIFKWVNPLPGVLTLAELRNLATREHWGSSDTGVSNLATAVLMGVREEGREKAREILLHTEEASRKYDRDAAERVGSDDQRFRQAQRLVMLIWLMERHGVPTNSRATEYMMEDAAITIGTSQEVTRQDVWREHVVPCLYIHVLVRERIAKIGSGADDLVSLSQVDPIARVVARLATMAYLSTRESQMLDHGTEAMRSSMPEGWDPDTGCVMVRLCNKSIRLTGGPAACVNCPLGRML